MNKKTLVILATGTLLAASVTAAACAAKKPQAAETAPAASILIAEPAADSMSFGNEDPVVVKSLHQADLIVGKVPSDGAHATVNDIAPFVQYFQGIVANEIYHDYLFVTHKDENVWWYDGEMIEFRTPNYAKILRMMQMRPALTQEDMRNELGISLTAVRKLVGQLTEKNYVERNTKDGSWRVIITPSM